MKILDKWKLLSILFTRVQRVIGNLNSRRVWTQRRKKAPEATSISNLRFATNDEVGAYLDKSEALATA